MAFPTPTRSSPHLHQAQHSLPTSGRSLYNLVQFIPKPKDVCRNCVALIDNLTFPYVDGTVDGTVDPVGISHRSRSELRRYPIYTNSITIGRPLYSVELTIFTRLNASDIPPYNIKKCGYRRSFKTTYYVYIQLARCCVADRNSSSLAFIFGLLKQSQSVLLSYLGTEIN